MKDKRIKNTFIFMDYQNQPVDPELIVQKIEEFGKMVGGKAYGHWSKYPATMFSFSRHGIELIERPEDGFANKKGNDIKLAVDAIETMFSLPHIEIFILVTGDADFVPLIKKLRTYGKDVVVISRSKNTSIDMQMSADSYIPYEEIVKSEKIDSTDTFEDIVDEVTRIMEEKNLTPDENIIKRILTGIKVNYINLGYNTFSSFVEDIQKRITSTLFADEELSEYEENYMRFLERLIVMKKIPLTVEKLEKIASSRHQWITKNSKYSLKNFIENMIESNKIKKNSLGILKVPAPRRWEIRYEKILPYPEIRGKFAKFIFNLFENKKVSNISEALHISKEKLNLSNKIIGSFGMALKFSGLFRGKDGSDYVSLKTPVRLIGDFEEFKEVLDTFFIKRILKDEDIHEKSLAKISKYVYNKEDIKYAKNGLKYLMSKKEVRYEKPFYKYYK